MTIIFNGTTGIAGAGSVTGMTLANTAISGTITSSQLDSTVNALFPYTNKIINGDFRIWQRGTSFSGVSSGQYTTDRWMVSYRTAGVTVAKQNNQYYQAVRLTNTDGSVQSFDFEQRIEDTSQFDNTTYTLSFYAKASTAVTVASQVYANYGSGGSSQDTVNVVNHSVTTTRTRFTMPLVFPDMSAKTIADPSWVRVLLSPTSLPSNAWVEYDSVQINYGSTALPFQTRHIQQEISLCQRYYFQQGGGAYTRFGGAIALGRSSTQATSVPFFPVAMRTFPTVAGVNLSSTAVNGSAVSSISCDAYESTANFPVGPARLNVFVGGGLSAGVGYEWESNNNNTTRITFSAEL
jgi:hypothetical protein